MAVGSFSLLIGAVVLTHQAVLWTRRRRFDVFDVSTLIDAVLLIMFVYALAMDAALAREFSSTPEYALAVLVGIAGLYLGLHWPWRSSQGDQRIGSGQVEPVWLWFAAIGFFALGAATTIVNARQSGMGVLQYLTGERLSAYLGSAIFGGAFYYTLMIIASQAALVLLGILAERRQWLQAAFVYGALLLASLGTFRTRLGAVTILAFPIAYYHFRRRRVSPVLLAGLVPLFLGVLAFLNVWRSAGLTSAVSGDISADYVSESLGQDVNPVRSFAGLLRLHMAGLLPHEGGLNYLYAILSLVPRFLWPEKPVTAFEPRWTLMTQGTVEGGVEVFTAWGEGLAQFGFPGVFLNLMLYGLVLSKVRSAASRNPQLLFVWFQYAVFMATFLRGGFQAMVVYTALSIIPALIFLRLASPPPREIVTKRGRQQLRVPSVFR